MCGTSYGTALLKITFSGSTLVTSPLVGEKPCGWFIQELTATTENAPPSPVTTIGDEHDRRERHAERCQHDVEAERERHLAARRLQLRRGELDGGEHRSGSFRRTGWRSSPAT